MNDTIRTDEIIPIHTEVSLPKIYFHEPILLLRRKNVYGSKQYGSPILIRSEDAENIKKAISKKQTLIFRNIFNYEIKIEYPYKSNETNETIFEIEIRTPDIKKGIYDKWTWNLED